MQVSLCEFHMKFDTASGQSVGRFSSSFSRKKASNFTFTAEAEYFYKRLNFLLNQPFVLADLALSGCKAACLFGEKK